MSVECQLTLDRYIVVVALSQFLCYLGSVDNIVAFDFFSLCVLGGGGRGDVDQKLSWIARDLPC